MYPGKTDSDFNHKKQYCSDGARQVAQDFERLINGQKVKVVEEPPPYPQPAGIFAMGVEFHATRFLAEVSSLYDRVVVRKEVLGMQDLALASLLHQRTLIVPASESNPRSMTLFKLYHGLRIESCPPHFLVEYEGIRYLQLDALADARVLVAVDAVDDEADRHPDQEPQPGLRGEVDHQEQADQRRQIGQER